MSILNQILDRVLSAADGEIPAAVELGWRAGVGAPDSPAGDTTVVTDMQQQMVQGASGAGDGQFTSIVEATRTIGESGKRLVDVGAVLDAKRARGPSALDWRTSIADLMELVDLDHTLESRRALARELGGPADSGDVAALDGWLHRAVMNELAEHGGELPQDLQR
jgi:hypothetical protein